MSTSSTTGVTAASPKHLWSRSRIRAGTAATTSPHDTRAGTQRSPPQSRPRTPATTSTSTKEAMRTPTRLPPTDTGACGEFRGAKRHGRRGEQNCDPCRTAYTAHERARRAALRASAGKPTRTQSAEQSTQAIIEEIEFFLQCGEGEHAILTALETTQTTLKRRLHRAKRADLMPRIFQPTANEYVRRAA